MKEKMSIYSHPDQNIYIADPKEDEYLSGDNYYKVYCNMNPLGRKYNEVKYQEGKSDFFFFVAVPEEEISTLMTISSQLDPLIQLCDNFEDNITYGYF